jgi:hypothetical protein
MNILSAQHQILHITNPSANKYDKHSSSKQTTASYSTLAVFPITDEPFGD